jgi:hypothetical protein
MNIFDFVKDVFEEVFSWFVDIPDEGGFEGTQLNKDSNVAPVPIVYGTRKVGGIRVFMESGGNENRYIYIALVLCEGEISAIHEIFFDDKSLFEFPSRNHSVYGNFNAIDPETDIVVRKYLGTDDQTADALLMEADGWTSSHTLSGLAYLAVRLKWNTDYFTRVPTITAVVRGKKVTKPHQSPIDSVGWSNNPAMCLRD